MEHEIKVPNQLKLHKNVKPRLLALQEVHKRSMDKIVWDAIDLYYEKTFNQEVHDGTETIKDGAQ